MPFKTIDRFWVDLCNYAAEGDWSSSVNDIQDRLGVGLWYWWLFSVPYSIIFLASIALAELFGISGWSLGHSGGFLLFGLIWLITSVSSGLWFFTVLGKFLLRRSVRMNTIIVVMLILSAIPTLMCGWYLVASSFPQYKLNGALTAEKS